MPDIHSEIDAYRRHKNLRLAAEELGMKWQSLYVHLRSAGVAVTGDKARYGCAKDRLGTFGESLFYQDVPEAIDSNRAQFQANIDFDVLGWSVDVKTATPSADKTRWSFGINKQKDRADFFVMYALDDATSRRVIHGILIPREIATAKALISLPVSLNSKWTDYFVERNELATFFRGLGTKRAERQFSVSPLVLPNERRAAAVLGKR